MAGHADFARGISATAGELALPTTLAAAGDERAEAFRLRIAMVHDGCCFGGDCVGDWRKSLASREAFMTDKSKGRLILVGIVLFFALPAWWRKQCFPITGISLVRPIRGS